MTATDYFLEQAARDVSTERAEMARQAARVEVSQFWPFLSAAQDEADFNNRVALVEAEMTEAMRPVTPDPRVHASVIAGLREDWKTLTAAAQRKEALNVGDTVLIDTRAGQGKWINVVWNGNFSFTAIMPDGQKIPFTTERAPVTKDDAKIMAREWVQANAPHLIDGYPVTASRTQTKTAHAPQFDGHVTSDNAVVGQEVWILGPGGTGEGTVSSVTPGAVIVSKRSGEEVTVLDYGWEDGQSYLVVAGHTGSVKEAARELVCGSCGHTWTSRARYRIKCPNCGAEENIRQAAQKTTPTPTRGRATASVTPLGSAPGGPEPVRGRGRKHAQTAWIEVARQVAQNHQHAEVDGMILDATTANGLVKLFDSLSPENQARFAAMPLEQAVDTMWKVVNRTSSRKQANVGDPCPSCKGKGYYRIPMGGDWDDPYGEQMMEVTCSTCGGSGEVNEPTDYPLADDPIFTDRYSSRRVTAKYYIREEGGKYWVYDEDGNKRHKEGYDSKEEARSYQKALYANSKDASRRTASLAVDENRVAVCGSCDRAWDIEAYPTPASLCPFCNGDEVAAAPFEVVAVPAGAGLEWRYVKDASRKTATETEPCWDCGGTGAVPAGGWEDPADVDNGYVRCPTCKGTGTITKEASVNADLWGTRTAMPNPVDLGVKVGDIFYSSWGYDQTNIDFYEVVGLTGASVKIRPINKRAVGNPHAPQVQVVPIPGAYIGDVVMTKRIKDGYQGRPAISISSYQGAWLWDGTPKYQTGSGWGH